MDYLTPTGNNPAHISSTVRHFAAGLTPVGGTWVEKGQEIEIENKVGWCYFLRAKL